MNLFCEGTYPLRRRALYFSFLQVYNKLSYSLEGEPVRPAEAEAGNQDTREIGVGFVSMKLKR